MTMEINHIESMTDIEILSNKAEEMIEILKTKGLFFLLGFKIQDAYDEYLKRMLFSFFDLNMMVKRANINRNEFIRIKAELICFGVLSEDSIRMLLKKRKERKYLLNLMNGALSSFVDIPKTSFCLFPTCLEIQRQFGLFNGTIGEYDETSITLPNGEKLISPEVDCIESLFELYQKKYEESYKNDSDEFFIVKSVEIFSSILINQMFRKGNKRTSKALMYRMLLSRGIVPPIADLTENYFELFDEIVLSQDENFSYVGYKLFLQTIDVHYQLSHGSFKEVYQLEIDKSIRERRYVIR